MTVSNAQFRSFLNEEIRKVRNVYYPVKAGLLRRLLIKKASCKKLHPNPNDEFCYPEIGPNFQIISHYIRDYSTKDALYVHTDVTEDSIATPLMVEKCRPDGYIILNGHHRWAAAIQLGMKKIPVKIVDLTQEKDVKAMLSKAASNVHVSLDLDEVVFCGTDGFPAEKPLRFPFSMFFTERIRLGIPSLFHSLGEQGYDVWVYTAKYYSIDYLKSYFRHYGVRVTGIVTGTARKGPRGHNTAEELRKMLSSRYKSTIHISRDSVLFTSRDSKEYNQQQLSGNNATWVQEVKDMIGDIKI